MSTDNPWDTELTDEYAVSIGIYCLFFPYGVQENYMKGFKVTDIAKSANVRDQKEVGHQLASGRWKNHIALMADAGTLDVSGFFEFERGTIKPPDITRSRVKGPEGTVMLAINSEEADKLEVFFMCGANLNEDGDIGGTHGDVMTQKVKFKLSGEPKMGTLECNTEVDKSLAVGSV